MKSKEFLYKELRNLVMSFPSIKVTYQYESFLKTHTVEVLPSETYFDNEQYKLAESDLTYIFDDKFFPESLLFISEGSLSKIKNPEFQMEGPFFNILPLIEHKKEFKFELNFVGLDTEVENNSFALAA